MLNVSEAVKQAYMTGNASTEVFLTVTSLDGVTHEYTPRNILSGSVTIVESLCSSEAFDVSRVEKNELTFTLFNISEGIEGLQGAQVVAKQTITLSDGETTADIPLGTYTITDAINDGDYLYKCTAYEATTLKLDALIDEWWETVTFPITLRELLVSMLTYLGCTYNIPQTFVNSDYVIESMNASFEGVTGAEILGYIQEIVGGFFKADRQGVIRLKTPVPVESGLQPYVGLYPSADLLPHPSNKAFGEEGSAGFNEFTYPQIVGDLQLGDYDVKAITKVQIRGTEDDVGIIAGDGTNTYVIQGNPLLFNLTADTGAQVAENILSAIQKVYYKPFSGKFMAQPYIEVGDVAKIETYKGHEGDSPIFNRTLGGARLAFDTYKCLGLEYREQVSSVNRKITTLNQRTHEVINSVDQLSSTVSNVEQRVTQNSTNITQNANSINLSAQRSGVFNLLTNSDFSDQTNRTIGWETVNMTGVEYDSGEDWQNVSAYDYNGIENGNYLKLTTGEVTAYTGARVYQTINYNGTISEKLQGQVTYKVYSLGTATARLYLRAYEGDTAVLFTYVDGWFSASDKAQCVRWVLSDTGFAQLQGRQISRIEYGVWISSSSSDTVAIGLNHFLLTFGNTLLPWFSWTNYASKNLIAQINVSPSGVKIQGEKVDIYGLTTFHNSDGTGGTTVDGATITAGTINGTKINGAVIDGSEIDSGDMYWYKGTTNEARITKSANINFDGSTYKGVSLEGSLVHIDTKDGLLYLHNNKCRIWMHNSVIGISRRLGGGITVDDDGVAITTEHIDGTLATYHLTWKPVKDVDGTTQYALCVR